MKSELVKSEFINESGLEFTDISSELYRQYDYIDYAIRLEDPVYLNVSASGGHRVFTADGCSHYLAAGWRHLSWKAKPGRPNFVK